MYKDKELEEIILLVINIFYEETKIKPIEIEIEFVNDLYQRKLELSTNPKEINEIKAGKSFIQGLNGTMILPSKTGDIPYILISTTTINNDLYIGTIIHELTHIYDFYDFIKYINYAYFKDIEKHKDFPLFYQWTEYHARRTGITFIEKYT